MRNLPRRVSAVAVATVIAVGGVVTATIASATTGHATGRHTTTGNFTSFSMVRSATAVSANCLQGANAQVNITSTGPVEVMNVHASHLPPNTDFDLFVIQVPNAPFGISWYQGDLDSDSSGHANGTFIGRFSIETFAVAPGTAPAPRVFNKPPFPDASSNPAFGPVQMYHVGLWFNAPNDAAKAGCPNTVTPFNGEHNAGVQALSTRNFPDQNGPLRKIRS